MSNYHNQPRHLTHSQIIEAHLKNSHPAWVCTEDLVKASGSMNIQARLNNLRVRYGCGLEVQHDGSQTASYRLSPTASVIPEGSRTQRRMVVNVDGLNAAQREIIKDFTERVVKQAAKSRVSTEALEHCIAISQAHVEETADALHDLSQPQMDFFEYLTGLERR
jgi:hypothetical protein